MAKIIVGGMDVSGDNVVGNYKYLAIIIGTQESIERISKQIGRLPNHISSLNGKSQVKIIGMLNFDGKNTKGFCIQLKRFEIIKMVKDKRKAKRRGLRTRSILNAYNYVIMQETKKLVEKFLLKHGVSITEFKIQCESDCRPFAKAGSLQYDDEGNAYRISDIVAYCNNMGWPILNVDEINFTKDVPKRMMKILKL